MNNIKSTLAGMTLTELNQVDQFISTLKVAAGKAELSVGQPVWVVQKSKRTEGTIRKINKTRCIVDMDLNGFPSQYNVPMTMLEPREEN